MQKEFDAAKLYYDLGTYNGNCIFGGNNYEACIITAENAIKTFPYTNLKEDLSILILRAKYKLAQNSVVEKEKERFQNAIDEYYGFKNEFPESKYLNEAEKIFKNSSEKIGTTPIIFFKNIIIIWISKRQTHQSQLSLATSTTSLRKLEISMRAW